MVGFIIPKVQRDQRQPLKRRPSTGRCWKTKKKGLFRSVEFSGDVAVDGVGFGGVGRSCLKTCEFGEFQFGGGTTSDRGNDLERMFGNARSWAMS